MTADEQRFRDDLDDAIMAAYAEGATGGIASDYAPLTPAMLYAHPPHMRKVNAICNAAWAVVERWTEPDEPSGTAPAPKGGDDA